MTPCTCDKWRDFRKPYAPGYVSEHFAKHDGWEYCPWCGKTLSESENPREDPASMTQRSLLAEQAFFRDIAKKREEYEIVMAAKDQIPEGCHLVECYETEKNFVVIGIPDSNDETHNCDFMGCSTLSHVITRFPKPNRKEKPREEAEWRVKHERLKFLEDSFELCDCRAEDQFVCPRCEEIKALENEFDSIRPKRPLPTQPESE